MEKQIGAAIAGTTAILGMIAGLGAVSMASNVLRVTGAFEALSGIFGTASGWMLSIRMLAPWILSLGEAAGWIGLAVGGIMTINHLPDIAGRITQWWERNQNMISYTIGYAFGTIGHWIVAAMKNLIGVAMSAVGALLGTIGSPSEFAKLMLPGGGAFVAADVARSVSQALNSYKYIGADPGGQALRGLYGGYQGHSYQPPAALRGKYGPGAGAGVHLSIDKLEFHFGKDISPEDAGKHAGDTLSALSLHPRIALNTGGAFRTSPLLPISQTVGGMTFGK